MVLCLKTMILWPLCMNLTVGFSADQCCLWKSIISSFFHWSLMFLVIYFSPLLKHKNFYLGMFFWWKRRSRTQIRGFWDESVFSIFFIIKDSRWTWAFSSSSRPRTCTYMETQKGFGKNLAQSKFAVKKSTSHRKNNWKLTKVNRGLEKWTDKIKWSDSPPPLFKVRISENFLDSKIFVAKAFQIKRLYRANF